MATPAGFGFGMGSVPPAAAATPLPEGWCAVVDPMGRTYYANPKTGETTWVKPEVPKVSVGDEVEINGLHAKPQYNGCRAQVEGFDAEKDRYTVRCINEADTVLALKAANLSIVTPPPPPPPQAPQHLGSTNSSKFEPSPAQASQAAAAQPAAATAPPPPPSPSPRSAKAAPPPPPPRGFDGVYLGGAQGAQPQQPELEPVSAKSAPATSTAAPPNVDPLPPGWVASIDPSSGAMYYSNPQTGERTWYRPQGPGGGGGGGGGGG